MRDKDFTLGDMVRHRETGEVGRAAAMTQGFTEEPMVYVVPPRPKGPRGRQRGAWVPERMLERHELVGRT